MLLWIIQSRANVVVGGCSMYVSSRSRFSIGLARICGKRRVRHLGGTARLPPRSVARLLAASSRERLSMVCSRSCFPNANQHSLKEAVSKWRRVLTKLKQSGRNYYMLLLWDCNNCLFLTNSVPICIRSQASKVPPLGAVVVMWLLRAGKVMDFERGL
jgi:hypothetical protein